jgi:hypothetical protein
MSDRGSARTAGAPVEFPDQSPGVGALQQLGEGDPGLELGQGRAEAEVDAAAQRELRVDDAVEVEPVGVREGAVVAVRRAEQQQDGLAGFISTSCRRASLVRVRHRPLDGGVEAQHLADRARRRAGS